MRIENVEISRRCAKKNVKLTTVYADITAPLYWWREYCDFKTESDFSLIPFDRDFTLADFYYDNLNTLEVEHLKKTIELINCQRKASMQEKDESWKHKIMQMLPLSYMLKGTVMLNYGTLTNMYFNKRFSYVREWTEFCEWIKTLPQSEEICRDRRK